jgi:hypothetical protein
MIVGAVLKGVTAADALDALLIPSHNSQST